MSKLDDFGVFILTYQRAGNVLTYNTLRKLNSKVKIYLLVDDNDKDLDKYEKMYDNVVVFNKAKVKADLGIDMGDNFNEECNCVIPRNYCFELAKELGLKYFVQMDDDYTNFVYRYEMDGVLKYVDCKEIDKIFEVMLDFLDDCRADAVCFSQGGDFIGGLNSNIYVNKVLRKMMNVIFCKTDRPFKFSGTLNDDVTVYTRLGSLGRLFLTPYQIMIHSVPTQKNKGGLTGAYSSGTYLKSFYTVMYMPSAVKIGTIGSPTNGHKGNFRIHHKISWNNCIPKLLSSSFKKGV